MSVSPPPGPSAGSSAGPAAVRGVVWDLGNVLVDWDPLAAIAAGVGEERARAFLAAVDFHAWNHAADAGLDWDANEARLAAEHPEWADAGRAYRRHFAASLRGEVPGTTALVRALHAAGVGQWGLTNWSSELYHPHAPRHEAVALLRDVVVSGDVGLAKPDPRIYALTVARTGLRADELVFVDDRADNVRAAEAAGMVGVVFTDAGSLRERLGALGLPV
ncbi:HAD family phosphatase [Nocardioides sp. GY 10127]|uniref:HAD family hydrolase n=1 Tax=Nocardioides sp. GY 10127 TaxID=2569762 RepID=UPI0010A8D3B0|nr:HAD family phosphatase [Nocardioides sp. GY 10127]TIC81841.1 HAD family phosphatase [Nocardioides sp. GY 10127]